MARERQQPNTPATARPATAEKRAGAPKQRTESPRAQVEKAYRAAEEQYAQVRQAFTETFTSEDTRLPNQLHIVVPTRTKKGKTQERVIVVKAYQNKEGKYGLLATDADGDRNTAAMVMYAPNDKRQLVQTASAVRPTGRGNKETQNKPQVDTVAMSVLMTVVGDQALMAELAKKPAQPAQPEGKGKKNNKKKATQKPRPEVIIRRAEPAGNGIALKALPAEQEKAARKQDRFRARNLNVDRLAHVRGEAKREAQAKAEAELAEAKREAQRAYETADNQAVANAKSDLETAERRLRNAENAAIWDKNGVAVLYSAEGMTVFAARTVEQAKEPNAKPKVSVKLYRQVVVPAADVKGTDGKQFPAGAARTYGKGGWKVRAGQQNTVVCTQEVRPDQYRKIAYPEAILRGANETSDQLRRTSVQLGTELMMIGDKVKTLTPDQDAKPAKKKNTKKGKGGSKKSTAPKKAAGAEATTAARPATPTTRRAATR